MVSAQPSIDSFRVVISGYVLDGDTVIYTAPKETLYQTKKELRNRTKQFDYIITKGDVKVTYDVKIWIKCDKIEAVKVAFRPMVDYQPKKLMAWTFAEFGKKKDLIIENMSGVKMKSIPYGINELEVFLDYKY